MKNKPWMTLGAAAAVGLLLAVPPAEAACTYDKRKLRLGINTISLQQTDARCVLSAVDGESGTFEIQVRGLGGYVPDLDAISVRSKDEDGPVAFEVAQVKANTKTLVVLVTWDGEAAPDAEYAYAIDVQGLGYLDPRVQIIRTSPRIAYTSALLELAELYLDEDAQEFIARELLRAEGATAE